MYNTKYETHTNRSEQGMVIGDHASGTSHFSPLRNSNWPTPSPYRDILSNAPLTDPDIIQQRRSLVKSITTKLMQPDLNALVLTGIGGIGKSTIAALVYRFVEAQCQQGASRFAAPPLWLNIDGSTTFADIMSTIYQAIGKPLPDLKSLSSANQAHALCTLLSIAPSRLIVLDQFEYLLNRGTGAIFSDRPGIDEWVDALNSEHWSSECRLLLTGHPQLKRTREYAPIGLQEYPIEALTVEEGIDLFGKRGLQAEQADLRKTVDCCRGHPLSLTLLITLVQEYAMSLTELLADAALWVGDITTNLLTDIFEQLSDIQCDLLRAFSVYQTPVPIEAVQAVSSTLSLQSILPELRALLTQHLIQATTDKLYQPHPIVASYAKQHFIKGNDQENQHALQQAHASAAQYCLQQAHKEQALNLYEQALALYCDAGDLSGQATALNNLGLASYALGKTQEVLNYFEQALALRRDLGDLSSQATILNNMGSVSNTLGKTQEALNYFEQALALRRE